MKLSELQEEQNITIEIRMNKHSMECQTTVAKPLPVGVLIHPIRMEGKILNFNAEGVTVNLLYLDGDNPPEIWRGIKLTLIEQNGEKYYQCLFDKNSVRMNRRGAYRVSVSQEGIIRVGAAVKGIRVDMRDLSESGFSFYLQDEKTEISVNEQIHLTFETGKFRFNLFGIVVRVSEKLVCCSLVKPNALIPKFVAEKQREKMMLNKRANKK